MASAEEASSKKSKAALGDLNAFKDDPTVNVTTIKEKDSYIPARRCSAELITNGDGVADA